MKKLLYLILAVVAIAVVAAVFALIIFDPDDLRDRIAAEVQRETGRELVIDGEFEFSVFPWLAVQIGSGRLGNAPGFGDEPFAAFDEARLSVRLMPLLLRREASVGVATLDGLVLNLAVDRNGRTNWEDLLEAGEAVPAEAESAGAPSGALDIQGISIGNATLTYTDAQLGETYLLTNLDLSTGQIAAGQPVAISGSFDFELQPADLSGRFEIDTDMALDTAAGTIGFSDVDVTVAGVEISADVEPFAYANDGTPVATFDVSAFSFKSLMQALAIEPLETADPDALGKVMLNGTARMTPQAITVNDLELVIDDTTFSGRVSQARDAAGTITVDLTGDSIDLGRYMAPADGSSGGGGEAVPVEIPAELIQALNLRGQMALQSAVLSGIEFENPSLGVDARGGVLRMHPISAGLFGGSYEGDVRIDASGTEPVLSVNERVSDVNLGSLARAMFDQENVTGSINGTFTLSGQGADLAQVQQSLRGNMSFELLDGAFEGTDVWYELRRARALFKKEEPPEPQLPARTQFSAVKLTGPVRDGVFTNDDLFAELPFMQLTGKGSVDLVAAKVDYRLSARVFEKPEFAGGMTEEELKDFTKAVIPLRITGPLAAPSIKPDVEEMLRKEVEDKVRDKLEDKLKDLLNR